MPFGTRPPRAAVTQRIQLLMRMFPRIVVEIRRGRGDMLVDPVTGETSWGRAQLVYRGEALELPVGGMVDTLALGQIEVTTPTLLIAGSWPIEQGDFVDIRGDRYQVSEAPDQWHAFHLVRLKQFQQEGVP